MYYSFIREYTVGDMGVSLVERLSLYQRVIYRSFHCINNMFCDIIKSNCIHIGGRGPSVGVACLLRTVFV